MYKSFGEIWNGWAKGLFPLLEKRLSWVAMVIAFTAAVYLLPIAVLLISLALMMSGKYLAGGFGIALAALSLILVAGSYSKELRQNNFPISSIFLIPFSAIIFIAILIASVYRHKTGRVGWKGREYSAK